MNSGGKQNSLTLLKSKMSRRKARSAPTNQAPLYLEKTEPSVQSARQSSESFGYASSSGRRPAQEESMRSSSSSGRNAAQQQQQQQDYRTTVTGSSGSRRSMAAAESSGASSRRLPRHQEEADEDEDDAPAPTPPARRGSVPLPVATRSQEADSNMVRSLRFVCVGISIDLSFL
ncbi:hypothetical protein PINS_up007320 [Pythium insidiosum]|nr:hypothetical protein PINS_up007320 [Pythium insidiosum]